MATAKDIFIDFINLIFGLTIIGLSIIYFIAGNHFETFRRIMESLAPFGVLGIFFLIAFKLWRQKAKKREREGNMNISLELTFVDKLKSDLFVFLLPAVVLGIAFIANGRVALTDVFSAAAVLALAYLWEKWIFSKER